MLDKEHIDEELSKLNIIFEKICNNYKNQFDEYLFETTIEKYLLNPGTKDKIEIIDNNSSFIIKYPDCYLRRENKKDINVKFLVKAKFIDESKKKFFFLGLQF